jgi:hypothetical protein
MRYHEQYELSLILTFRTHRNKRMDMIAAFLPVSSWSRYPEAWMNLYLIKTICHISGTE